MLSAEQKAKFVQPGMEAMVMRQHGRVLGRTLTLVTPDPSRTYIRVLPTSTLGNVPIGSKTVIWATISWSLETGTYKCKIHNSPETTFLWLEFTHPTLKSALRRARKTVAKCQTERPPCGWTRNIQPLHSLYPSEDAIAADEAYARAYWDEVERQMWEEQFTGELEY